MSGASLSSERESRRARSVGGALAYRERVVSCAQRRTRPRLSRASRVVRAAQQRVVSCAQRKTRPRLSRASRVVRAAQDATSRRADASTWLEWLAEPRALRPSEARPDHTTRSSRSTVRPSVTPRVVRSAHDTRRTYAPRSSQGPYARGSCHARELVTRAATFKRESDGNPRGDRRPPAEGRTGHGPRNPTDSETTRSRVGAEPPRVSRDVSRSAHTRPRSRSSPGAPRARRSDRPPMQTPRKRPPPRWAAAVFPRIPRDQRAN